MTPGSRIACTRTPSTRAPRAPCTSSSDPSDGPAPGRRDSHCRGQRSARWCVRFARVMPFHDLDRLEIRSGLGSEPHHQHSADREVGHDQTDGASRSPGLAELGQALRSETGGPDHSSQATGSPTTKIVEDDVVVGGLYHDVSPHRVGIVADGHSVQRLPGPVGIEQTSQLQVVGGYHRVSDRTSQLPTGSGDNHLDHPVTIGRVKQSQRRATPRQGVWH